MQVQKELFTSEWGVRNDVKHLVEALQDKLPAMGMVKNANKNRCLEKFRKAQNVTYDIFNNGLINRGKSLIIPKNTSNRGTKIEIRIKKTFKRFI